MRVADIHRKTNETEIKVKLNLDGSGNYNIHTGLGFLDHMLSHLAVHGLFNLDIEAKGDLTVDCHHTVEDCALVLGEAFNEALGERKGITRIASVYVPMDEALALVVIDFSGRPYAIMQAEWHGPSVGDIPTSLLPHFFQSLATASRCNLHSKVLYGNDNHHQAEALFKALGRVLHAATRIDPQRGDIVPSTKGSLA